METNNWTVRITPQEYYSTQIFDFSTPPYSWALAAKRRSGDTKMQRQALKTVNQLFSYFSEFERIEGITGRPETWRTSKGSIPGGGLLPEDHPTRRAWEDLGKRFDWKITRENSEDIVDVATPLVLQAELDKIILDMRTGGL